MSNSTEEKRLDQQYQEFLDTKPEEFMQFLDKHVPNPVGKTSFKPRYYDGRNMVLKEELRAATYRRVTKLSIFLFIATAFAALSVALFISTVVLLLREPEAIKTGQLLLLLGGISLAGSNISARVGNKKISSKLAENQRHRNQNPLLDLAIIKADFPAAWVKSRYQVDESSYLGPPAKHEDNHSEYDEDKDPQAREKRSESRYPAGTLRWYWKPVGDGEYILADRKTGEEAPLLPGQKPFTPEEGAR